MDDPFAQHELSLGKSAELLDKRNADALPAQDIGKMRIRDIQLASSLPNSPAFCIKRVCIHFAVAD